MKNLDMFADLSATLAGRLFLETVYPWEVLPMIQDFVRKLGPTLSTTEYDHPSDEVWIHKSAKIYPYAYIEGPTIIGAGTEVRVRPCRCSMSSRSASCRTGTSS